MPPRHDQCHVTRAGAPVFLHVDVHPWFAVARCIPQIDECGHDMTDQVIDGDEWSSARGGRSLGEVHPYEQRAGQTGSVSRCDHIDVVPTAFCISQRGIDHRGDVSYVLARCHLWHDAAVLGVYLGLTSDDIGAQAPVGVDYASGRFIARCLNP